MKSKKILIEVGHPAHVHMFKNLYWELLKKNWDGLFVAKDKECVVDLLKYYRLPYTKLSVTKENVILKILSLPYLTIKMIKIAYLFKPDIFISRVSPLSGYASFLFRRPHVTFTDTENVRLLDSISEPFASVILTSISYKRDHGKRQIRYPGIHELAYLHPNRYKPDPVVLNIMGVKKDERYAIIRFVAWKAHHDIGQKCVSEKNKIKLVKELSKDISVFVSSEGELPKEIRSYQIKIKPEQMHDALAFAHLFIGESGTMPSECAVLGVPNIQLKHSIAEKKIPGVHSDIVDRGLDILFEANDIDNIISKAKEIIEEISFSKTFMQNRDKMLSEYIDLTSFMSWFIEYYPESAKQIKSNPGLYSQFVQK